MYNISKKQPFLWSKIGLFSALARWDKPIGVYFLLWPCWWGILCAGYQMETSLLTLIRYLSLFTIGAIAMRGAGCTLNDWLDKDLDAQVERTQNRPLAAGALSSKSAFWFFLLQCFVGAIVLFYLPLRCWILGIIALCLLFLYPLMKRVTHWPQLVLGVAFNSGVWIGYTAITPLTGDNIMMLWPLYSAGICWTLCYDTIYALADLPDDLAAGNRSTAIRWGRHVKEGVTGCLSTAFSFWGIWGLWMNAGVGFWMGYAMSFLISTHLTYALYALPHHAPFPAFIRLFKHHHWAGFLLALGLFIDIFLRS